MRTKLYLLLLAPLISLGTTSCDFGGPTLKNVDVVLISGQSNGVGCTHSDCIPDSLGIDKYDEYTIGYNGIRIAYDCWTKMWNAAGQVTGFGSQNASKKNEFVKVTLGQGNGVTTFGPEIGIAEKLHGKYDDKLFLIKFACGGSNLKDDWLAKNSPMYPKFINYVKLQMENLKQKGYNPTIKAFCWMQGEGDSYPGYYGVYKQNLETFVGNVRTDLSQFTNDTGMAFIDAGISNAPDWQYYAQVNQAKAEFAEESPLNIYIDTIEAGLHTNQEPWPTIDTCHYDSESEVQLGHLFADAFEPFLEPVEE